MIQATHPSSFPGDGYFGIKALLKNPVAFFSHRHAAFLAGLGNFGVNNMLLTPEYGPRVRFGSVFTSAELAARSAPERGALHPLHALREDVPGKGPGREGLSPRD